MKKKDIIKENKRKFENIKRIRDKIAHKISPEEKRLIKKEVEQAWRDYEEVFRALSEHD